MKLLQWDMGAQPWGPGPRGRARAQLGMRPTIGFPSSSLLHGRGEAVKPPAEGALGWPRDYALVRAFDRLRAPPLRESDYEGLAEPARMAETNAALGASVPSAVSSSSCPWLPDVHNACHADISPRTRFVLEVLLPRVRRETPALATPEATGIDGVSLGGVLALRIGLSYPEVFGAVGRHPAGVRRRAGRRVDGAGAGARARRPGMRLRLLTSHDDYFHEPIAGVIASVERRRRRARVRGRRRPARLHLQSRSGLVRASLWNDRALAARRAAGSRHSRAMMLE